MVVCGSNHTAFLLKYEVHSDEYFTDKERGISGSRMLLRWGQLFPGTASIYVYYEKLECSLRIDSFAFWLLFRE